MDPRFLPFSVAAGILVAGIIILMLKLGMNIFRNNHGLRGLFGAALFFAGIVLGWAVLMAGFQAG
jgi:hypothetical protein